MTPTPEERAREIAEGFIRQITMVPQGQWDADVVEFETRSMDTAEVITWLTQRIAAALAARDEEHRQALLDAQERALVAQIEARESLEIAERRARQEAEERLAMLRESHQDDLRETDEMLDDFARALGLPAMLSEHEAPGYPHIMAAIAKLRQARQEAEGRVYAECAQIAQAARCPHHGNDARACDALAAVSGMTCGATPESIAADIVGAALRAAEPPEAVG